MKCAAELPVCQLFALKSSYHAALARRHQPDWTCIGLAMARSDSTLPSHCKCAGFVLEETPPVDVPFGGTSVALVKFAPRRTSAPPRPGVGNPDLHHCLPKSDSQKSCQSAPPFGGRFGCKSAQNRSSDTLPDIVFPLCGLHPDHCNSIIGRTLRV